MISILLKLKEKRNALGISQVDLSVLSGVSLPTLQRIESGKGNPSLENIELLTKALGLQVECKDIPVDWDALVDFGLPLQAKEKKYVHKTPEKLLKELAKASCSCVEGRERDALVGLVLAIQLHYQSFYLELVSKAPLIKNFLSEEIEGKHIKMKRQALDIISRYL